MAPRVHRRLDGGGPTCGLRLRSKSLANSLVAPLGNQDPPSFSTVLRDGCHLATPFFGQSANYTKVEADRLMNSSDVTQFLHKLEKIQ